MRDTKSRIIEASRDLFLEKGLKKLTMRAVARSVGISPTAIYRHFRNKEELIRSVMEEGFRIFGSYLFRALEEEGGMERLCRTGLEYIRFGMENPAYYRLIHMSPERLSHGVCCQPDSSFKFLLDRITQCQREGSIDEGIDVTEAGIYLWSQVHGIATFVVTGGIPGMEGRDDLLKMAESMILRSVKGLA